MINHQTHRILWAILGLLTLPVWIFSVRGQSVLSSGAWYRLAVTEAGLHQVTYAQLQSLGVDVQNIQPNQIRLYGYGGGMLEQSLAAPRYDDLPENAIQIVGGQDGRLDPGDYILFYGQSPHQLGYESHPDDTYALAYQKNLYADTTYYFLTVADGTSKRIMTAENVSQAGSLVDTYDDYAVHEQELENIDKTGTGSGREWYGESLRNGELSLPFALSNLADQSSVTVSVRAVGRSTTPGEMQVLLNNQPLGTLPVATVENGRYAAKGNVSEEVFEGTVAGNAEPLTVSLRYQGSGNANLDRVVVEARRQLVYPGITQFRNLASVQQPFSTFTITAPQNALIWDVTDPLNPRQQAATYDGTRWQFTTPTQGVLREFALATTDALLTPELLGAVANQNLKGNAVPNMVLVTHPDFQAEAERLAQFRREHDQLSVTVVTPQQIYNEFSSGRQDVSAIRNYLKYLYDQDSTQLKYLLLMGKCSYDYRDYLSNNTNYVPTYQSRNSVHPIFSYSSDDYYGFLEDDEGIWEEIESDRNTNTVEKGDHTLEIGIGRLPVKSAAEARAVVDKLIHYAIDPDTYGPWRDQVVFVADDEDGNLHQRDADKLTRIVDANYPDFNITKIYLDAFLQEKLPSGERSPVVERQIKEALKTGALIVNYSGHGSETRWTDENVFNVSTISQLKNKDKLPFFVTATCEFGRYDDPAQVSGGEQLVLNPEGGAIGLVTTTRPVYAESNLQLNEAFYNAVFVQEAGHFLTLGEIFKKTKNSALRGRINRNFSLLGDPSMTLAYPEDQVVIEAVEVLQADGTYQLSDTLRALDVVKMKGRIAPRADISQINEQFDGIVTVEILDKPTVAATLGSGKEDPMKFSQRNSVIHRGRARVKAGEFTLSFVMPKDIVYQNGAGKFSTYARSKKSDAHGADLSFIIGGSSTRQVEDRQPPKVRLFMDDTTFVNHGLTGQNTLLLAHLYDKHGINVTATHLGHALTATITRHSSDFTQTWMLHEFYQTDVDTYQSGTVAYPVDGLAEGEYDITLQAWDTYNNKSTATLSFSVRDQQSPVVSNFYNYPNPFTQSTHFVIDHNRAGEDLEVLIEVYNEQGALVHVVQEAFPVSASRLGNLYWDGTASGGNRLRPGLYLARMQLRINNGEVADKKFQKVIISH